MSLADLNEILELSLPDSDFDTIGGYVLNLFGELPHEGDGITADGLRFEVVHMKGTRILELLLTLSEP